MTTARLALLAAAIAAGACIPAEGPLMRPGEDCLGCHAQGGDGPAWTAAGTVFASPSAGAGAGVEGLSVRIVDSAGADFSVRTNAAGNFYTAEPLTFPLHVAIVRGDVTRWMMRPVEYGGCNGCHAWPRVSEAPGRIAAP